MTRVHDHTVSRRAKLFDLHRQLLQAGNGVRSGRGDPALDEATASRFRAAAIASLQDRPAVEDAITPRNLHHALSKRRWRPARP